MATDIEVAATGELPFHSNPRDEIVAAAIAGRQQQLEAELNADVEGAEPEAPVRRDPPAERAPAPAPAQPSVRYVEIDGNAMAVTPDQEQQLLRMGIMATTALHQYANQPQPIVRDDELRSVAHQIQFGDETEAAAALGHLVNTAVSRAAPRAPDENAIAQRALHLAHQQQRIQSETEIIRNEFADIMGNDQCRALAALNVEALVDRNRREGLGLSDLQVWRAAGNAVRSAMGTSAPRQRSSQSREIERPAQGNGMTIVEQMRRARGQFA